MDALPPIPTPVAQRWREFRIRALPILTFCLVLVGLASMWHKFVMPATVLGEVETITYNITAKEDGMLTEVNVERFENVTKDQQVGVVSIMDKEIYEAELAAEEAELRTLKIRMDLDKTRNRESITQLRMQLQNERIVLDDAQTRFAQAASEYDRKIKLNQAGMTNLLSESELEIARRDRDSLQLQIDNRKKLMADLENEIKVLQQTGVYEVSPQDATIEQNIKAITEKLRLASKPLLLKSPGDGQVSAVLKRPGERVMRGEAVATVVAPTSDRVIGYIRQPLNIIPTTNDVALIRTRSQKRMQVEGKIVQIGPSWLPLNPAMLAADVRRREIGLPVLIALPPNIRLTPGEFVDISIQFAKR